MSKRTPPYTSAELTESVDRLERLHGLLSRTNASLRATQDEEQKISLRASYARLTRNVETGEIRLQKQQEAVAKWEETNASK